MGIIFDLDQTLIDSISVDHLRRSSRWQEVYNAIPNLKPFNGVSDLIADIRRLDIPYSIVTNSTSTYCKKVVDHWGFGVEHMICYHDVRPNIKPHKLPMELAIGKMKVDPSTVISVGDDPKDIRSSKNAGITSIGVTWGISNYRLLEAENPDYLFHNVSELHEFILNRFVS